MLYGSGIACSLTLQTAKNGKNYWRAQSPDDQPGSNLPLGRVWTEAQHSSRGSGLKQCEVIKVHIWPVHTSPEHLPPHMHAWLNLLSNSHAATVNYPVPAWLLKCPTRCQQGYSLLKIFAQMHSTHLSKHNMCPFQKYNARVTWWSLSLQPCVYSVCHRTGKANGNADALSRATSKGEGGRSVWD